jgi:hypothetical protein
MTLPQLAIVVDTEEEFDWSRPFSRENRSTTTIPAQALAHEIYDPMGIVPTYVIDHPVATDPTAVGFLAALQSQGRAEIGAHLHPWVSPPHHEEVSARNSYHCNLPPELERAKIETLTAAIEQSFGRRPTIIKAGRYGFGANTAAVLKDLGYEIDCSFVPHAGFQGDGGPRYYGTGDQPFWLDPERRLLEVPLTSGFLGLLARFGPRAAGLFDAPAAQRMRVPGILARLALLERTRLTPEGVPADEQCQLLKAMTEAGRGFFTLTYHSPSLAPGYTPYVQTQEDLALFIERIRTVLRYFRDALGGEFTTLTRCRAAMLAGPEAAGADDADIARPLRTGAGG